MIKSSPDYMQLSLAAAMTLGLRKGRFYRNATLYCLNLLLTYPEGCRASCTYCGLAREEENGGADKAAGSFIRVEWPVYPTDLIIEKAAECEVLERSCISTLTHPNNMRDTLTILEKLVRRTKMPVSILSNPTTTSESDIEALHSAGADRFTVAVDLATEKLFEKHRGAQVKGPHKWERYWKTLEKAQSVFGIGNIGAHLIVGMGETEREMVSAVQKVSDIGGSTHLFSFYPEGGSRLEKMGPCDAAQYRRVQLARYMIDKGFSSYEKMRFDDEGKIIAYGVESEKENAITDSGRPFQTSGCPGKDCKETACNRPFGDGPPSDIRSYPFELEPSDVIHVRRQMNRHFTPTELAGVEQFKNVSVERKVWQEAMAASNGGKKKITLYLPSFKKYSTSELSNACNGQSFPTVSITGKNCALMCDHCRGRLLEPMIHAETPEALIEAAKRVSEKNGEGILITGGSDRENRLPFERFLGAIEKIKTLYDLKISVHVGLLDRRMAADLESAGVDTAMMDVIGSDETIRQVYHLDKTTDDFERSLENLCSTSMNVAPHIVMSLHYGKMLGEWNALKIVSRHSAKTLIVVAVTPHYAKHPSMFPELPAESVGRFLTECRKTLPDRAIVLGCARPGGEQRQKTDLYALAAGVDRIAFPADGTVAAAKALGYSTDVSYSCCSISKLGAGIA